MLNIGRLGADAAEYYLGEVASSPEAYYTGEGESPGRWVGSLAPALGLAGEVGAADLRAVLAGVHPITGETLVLRQATQAHGPRQHERLPLQDELYDLARAASRLRLSARGIRRLLWAGERAGPDTATPYLIGERHRTTNGAGQPAWFVRRSELERFEATTAPRRGRAGFDLTLRPPKSVSVLWALGTDDVRLTIRQAHRESVDAVIAHLERHALISRRRRGERIEAIGADGFVAAAFDHRTSRAGDPLLHTHVVTANLTRAVDGSWRSLDARPIYENARPAGVLYQAHLRRLLTERLGVAWEDVRNGWAEVDGVPTEVVRAFSKRRDEIEELLAESGYASARAGQAATLASRRAKSAHPDPIALADGWRQEAAALCFDDEALSACLGRVDRVPNVDREALLDDLCSPTGLTKHAASFTRADVVEALGERSGAGLTADDIDELADRLLASRRVAPVVVAGGAELVRRRGDAYERDVDRMRFTTPDLIRMEDDLLRWAGDDRRLPTTGKAMAHLGKVLDAHTHLSDEQIAAVTGLVESEAAVVAVAGRPGAGKTTAMAAYVESLAAAGTPVVGCSLAATAAAELERACAFGERTGRPASTIARLLVELDRRPLPSGAVVLVDEASMVGTRDLHRLAAYATAAGGALALVGDPDQHGAVETGGVFRALVARSPDGLELTENNRQVDPRDRRVIELFREGNVEDALSRYDDAGLVVRSASAAASYDRMVTDWWEHTRAGGDDPMIVGTNHARHTVNLLARKQLKRAGLVSGPSVPGRDEVPLSAGDWVVARRNDRRIATSSGGVLNGDAGRVVDVDPESGAAVVMFDRIGEVTLPPSYVSQHVQHGYARTTYGVQGATLDRAFVHVDDRTGFEEAYVAITRGRVETRIYLVDGTAREDGDVTHRAHASPEVGMDTVAESMQQRRASQMVHDIDPLATAVLAHAGTDLATLRDHRRRLEAILREGPCDVSEALCDAAKACDRARTALAAHKLSPTATVDRLEASLERHNARVVALRRRHELRQQFLDRHAAEVEALRVVRRAELAREAHVRAEARVESHPSLQRLLGRGPIHDRAVADAAEAVAVHLERFGVGAESLDTPLLGQRPRDGEAVMSFERAERLIAAIDHEQIVEVDRLARVPTLFD